MTLEKYENEDLLAAGSKHDYIVLYAYTLGMNSHLYNKGEAYHFKQERFKSICVCPGN